MTPGSHPTVLCLGGLDPSGGAGLAADIEVALAHGCRALPLATALTAQNARRFDAYTPVASAELRLQVQALDLAEYPPAVIKCGMLASVENARLVAWLMGRWQADTAPPLVLDPVLVAGAGGALAQGGLHRVLLEELLPLVTLATPNTAELQALTGVECGPAGRCDEAAAMLLRTGCGAVLLTGTDAAAGQVIEHRLYLPGRGALRTRWRRLPGSYHGSGCTLASAVSCQLALGEALGSAVDRALAYTWGALALADRVDEVGAGQEPLALPWRGSSAALIAEGQNGRL